MVPCPSPDEQKALAEALTALQQEIDLLKQLAKKIQNPETWSDAEDAHRRVASETGSGETI